MKKSIIILFVFITQVVIAKEINYRLSMPNPQNHYFHVEMYIEDFKEKEITVKLPVWAPGSYLVREFSKNLNQVKAENGTKNPLKIKKTSKNTWKIETNGSKSIRVYYEVYAFELSVRTSFLDLTHGFVSGAGVFMYVEGNKNCAGKLDVVPYKDFSQITTALPLASMDISKDGSKTFSYNDFDQLVDCPIEIGNQEIFEFTAAGIPHVVAIYGDGNYSVSKLKTDMKKIVEECTAVFGANPNKKYTFIIHNVVNGQGGLEHANSTVLSVNRWTYSGTDYIGFLSLVAHEYFHLWNVKRIRPIELGPFNYDEENYTSLLWVMEGFTSYYDELLLLRAGYYSQKQYRDKLQGTINYVEGSVGSRVQPLAHASYDAWIKAYRPNENSANTTMSYYSRGQAIASLLDAKIIANTKGKKRLDHFMQHLYKKFYIKKDRGFTEDEFRNELSSFAKENLDEFFSRYINGTEIPPYKEVFEKIGVNVKYTGSSTPSFGATLRQNGGKLIVSRVRSNSSCEDAGISVNDEIISCMGYRVDKGMFEGMMMGLKTGEKAILLISRDEIIYPIEVTMKSYEKPRFQLSFSKDQKKEKLKNIWLD